MEPTPPGGERAEGGNGDGSLFYRELWFIVLMTGVALVVLAIVLGIDHPAQGPEKNPLHSRAPPSGGPAHAEEEPHGGVSPQRLLPGETAQLGMWEHPMKEMGHSTLIQLYALS